MDITIQKGCLEHARDCEETLCCSELGRRYFSREGNAREAIAEGLARGNLYVALDEDNCAGFFYYLPQGAFHSFPYLHLIVVKEVYRSKGIGSKMMAFFEMKAFEKADKAFLVVADFNPEAKGFYERIGYRQVGEIPNLYRKGITEYLMMKEKEI